MTFRNYLLIGFTLIATLGTASAGVIAVNNADFTTLPVTGLNIPYGGPGGGAFSEAQIPGWTNGGASGQYQPATEPGAIFNYIPVSDTVAAYSNGPTISQTVGATVNQGDVYTLAVYLALRKDCCDILGGADLLVNGVRYDATGTAAPLGDWAQFTATYTGLAGDVGDPITIELISHGAQADFAAVSLNDVPGAGPVPEPASLALVSACLGCLTLAVRRRIR